MDRYVDSRVCAAMLCHRGTSAKQQLVVAECPSADLHQPWTRPVYVVLSANNELGLLEEGAQRFAHPPYKSQVIAGPSSDDCK